MGVKVQNPAHFEIPRIRGLSGSAVRGYGSRDCYPRDSLDISQKLSRKRR